MAALLLALALVPGARADGDPAGDYLVSNQVFLTSLSGSASPAQQRLLSTVRAANRDGFRVRVALVSNEYDLGSVTALWLKPRLYARFLGQELGSSYRGRLLVVMPNGFGFNWPGHSSSSAYRQLAPLTVGGGGDGAAVAALAAVRRLAAAAGVRLATISTPAARTGGSDTAAILAGALGGAAIVAALLGLVQRTRRARAPRLRLRRTRSLPASLRWAIPAVAMLCVAAAVLVTVALRHGGVSSANTASIVTPPPFSWPAGRRAAPDFVLRDQTGHRVSVGAYRGRPVIVTFIDPVCRNLCPLEAQVLNQVERQLPPSQRPVILAVSVDVWGDSRADMLQDVREWHLVPQWRWAVGRPRQLEAIWRRYGVSVSVVTKRVAHIAIHEITHTEGAYVIDGTGHERALFLWPFYPQDVERVLRQIA